MGGADISRITRENKEHNDNSGEEAELGALKVTHSKSRTFTCPRSAEAGQGYARGL